MSSADDGGQNDMNDDDPAYQEAMRRLAELKEKPIDQLTEAEKKEKLRLANRESARKMRRKQADGLQAAEAEQNRLEQDNQELMHKLAEGWYKYKEIRTENDLLKGELQALQAFQDAPIPEGQGDGATTQAQPTDQMLQPPEGMDAVPAPALTDADQPDTEPSAIQQASDPGGIGEGSLPMPGMDDAVVPAPDPSSGMEANDAEGAQGEAQDGGPDAAADAAQSLEAVQAPEGEGVPGDADGGQTLQALPAETT